jgi:LPS export ABC transporter protein LptC
MMSARTRRGVITLFMLSLLLVWLARLQDGESTGPIEGLDRRLDYALTDFEMRIFDEQGQLAVTVRAPRLANDASTGIGRVTQPRVEVRNEGFDWLIDAETAIVGPDREIIDLSGAVTVVRNGQEPEAWLTAEGSEVRLQVTPRVATSEREVELVDRAGRLTGRGFRIDMIRNEFELHEQVAGRYDIGTVDNEL